MPWATWQMAWVHRVIADKSPQNRYRRMLGYKTWPRIAPAAALYNLAMCMTFSLPFAAVNMAGWALVAVGSPWKDVGHWKYLVGVILPVLFGIVLSLPVRIIFARVAASMLPEEDEPILPFDRSFDGKVDPVVSGKKELSLLDAWTTFGWSARIRFVKIFFKGLGIEIALGCLGFTLMIFEAWVISP
ncbi:unnamed protein product [Penicillium salamii]|nr:unnamed protein product [Penicillium salamii]CAG8375147.1 unnamed protein product [Penicillium salamii]